MNLKQQLFLQAVGPLILLSLCLTIVTGIHLKDRAVLATNTKATSDLATGEAIVDLMYPGHWLVRDGILYKGGVKITNNFAPVDKIAALTGDTVTIFLNDTRVTTTVREKSGDRAIGTKVSDVVGHTVLKDGQVYLGEANVVGEYYQTAYKPIRDANGKIIGIFYVGISKKFSDLLIRKSLLTIAGVSTGITLFFALAALFFANRVIIKPLHQITEGTKALALGQLSSKVEVTSHNEIGELGNAYNQMLEELQKLSIQIAKATNIVKDGGEPELLEQLKKPRAQVKSTEDTYEEELPKGLNDSTLRQILAFLANQEAALSAEEVGDGVNLTRVTARRYLEYLEQCGLVTVETKYGMVGRPVKLYKSIK